MNTGIFKYMIILAAILLAGSCKEVDKLTHFNMDYDENVTISSTIGINLPFNLFTPDITTNSQQTFQINDTRKDLIEEIRLTGLVLEIVNKTDKDFSFLKSVKIYIGAEGMDEILVAWKEEIENDVGKTLHLETSSDDLKEYIKKDEFYLKLTSVTDKLILSDYEINVQAGFFVDARILGI